MSCGCLYPPQLLQLVEEQPVQELPVPAICVDSPPSPLLNEANLEKTRLAVPLHLGHEALSLALLTERRRSNLQLHAGHIYS